MKNSEKESVEKAEERRVGFVSIISHQLRTPLSIVKGYLEGLITGDQGKLNPGQKEYLADALKINKETINLVNDYLEACQLDTGNIKVSPRLVQMENVVEEVVDQMVALAKSSNCEITFEKPKIKLPEVKVDLIKIRQVIQNILTNAIRYSPGAGNIAVKLEKKGNNIIFSCQDQGVGIPLEEQEHIFTRFFRGKNVLQFDTKGSGLGLYLVRLVIESSGGKVWFESKPKKGTTFYFSLPTKK